MDYAIRFETRERVRTISVPCRWTLAEVQEASQRLRSWAMIADVPIAGMPFVTLDSPMRATVHLPISQESMPHAQTGIRLDAIAGSPIVSAQDVRFAEVRPVARTLRDAYETHGVRAEFHAVDRDFLSGEVRLPILRFPRVQDAFIALPGGDGVPVPAPTSDREPRAQERVTVVTIASQPRSGGRRIARAVSRRLGFSVADQEITNLAAEIAGVHPAAIDSSTRRHGFWARLLESVAMSSPPGEYVSVSSASTLPFLYSRRDYRRFVEKAVVQTADRGKAVIVGHGGQLVLSGRPDAFRVLITASEAARIAELVADGATPGEAKASIRRRDAELREYFQEVLREDWLAPKHYDLVISADNYDAETAAGIICYAAGLKERRDAGGVVFDDPGRGLFVTQPFAFDGPSSASQPAV